MNEPWQPGRSDRIRCCCRSLKLSSRGVAARCDAVPAQPFDAASGGASRGALTAPHDAQRIGDRRRLAPARAAAAGNRSDRRRARGFEPRAPAAFGAAADLCNHLAAAGVIAPIWGRFLSTYPEVHLELAVGEAPTDIVAK